MLRFFLNDAENAKMPRREWLRVGAALGWGLAARRGSASSDRAKQRGSGRAKCVIVVFASGGQSHLDMWDPKPESPVEIRGQFDTIATAVPGTRLCEHMPRLAKLADKYTIVRSMSHEDLDHGSAFYLSMTGRYHPRRSSNPLPDPNDQPAYSSILKRLRPEAGIIQPAVHINGPALLPEVVGPGQFGGLLGRSYDPMHIGDLATGAVAVPGLAQQQELPPVRLKARQSLLQSLEQYTELLQHHRAMADMGGLYGEAFELLADPQARRAFRIEDERDAVRARYGMNRAGQACLLARRLVEAGVPLITVIFNQQNRGQDKKPGETDAYGWDTHNDIFYALTQHLLPRFDLGFSALLEDLDQRGLLDETLVICMGEFGRAPRVALERNFAGSSPGRKHWAAVYSIVAAGAGVSRGQVLGRSDRYGAYPASAAYGPWDISATIFSALGIDPSGHFTDPVGLRRQISIGSPISGLYTG